MMVEYSGETEAEVRAKVEALEALRARKRIGYAAHIAYDPAEQQSIWKLRKAGLGLLLGTKGDRKPIAFVEDTAVEPAKLGPFIARFREILGRHGARARATTATARSGCLHIRPLINLKDAGEIRKMQRHRRGDHGPRDGVRRRPLRRARGRPRPEPVQRDPVRPAALRRVPAGQARLRPQGAPEPREHRRRPADDRAPPVRPRHTARGSRRRSSTSRGRAGSPAAVEMCNGIGVCRKKLEGTMCPSYMATLDEEHSTRGRANALRAVLSGKVPRSEFTGRRLYEVLDLCLECKACKAECPANVDMAKIKYEFLAHYYRANGLPLRNRLFGRIHALARIGSALAPLSNWIARSAPHRWLLERVAGIDRRRPLPAFAAQSVRALVRPPAARGERSARRGGALPRHVQHLPDARASPWRRRASWRPSGYRVVLADRGCCGRPMISKGMLDEARDAGGRQHRAARRRGAPGPADRRARALVPAHAPRRVPGARPHRGRAGSSREQSLLLEEFLQRELGAGRSSRKFAANGRRRCSTATATRRRWSGRAPRWPC